jgi:[protein-PII] uridylyltransferase
MTVEYTDLTAQRLDLAGTRSFTTPGAGPSRRESLARFTGEWLASIWGHAVAGRPAEGIALAAVGSLARGDAGPLSDVDLVLLHDGRSLGGHALTSAADRIWYPIWDAGVKLDHSVRTVNQCRQVASGDLSAAVGLLDLERVAGDESLVAAARSTVAHDWRANARKRLPQLLETLDQRHARNGDLAQSIEPDLKEAHGGLRDMAVLRALAAAWLTDRPHGAVDRAYQRLLDVRDALHVVTGRGRDRLAHEDHDAVAALLGHPDADEMLTLVSNSARVIAFSLDGTVRRAGQSQRARTLRVGPRRPQLNPLGYGLFEHDGEVVLGPRHNVATEPLLPLRAAVVAARTRLPIAPTTLANLTATPELPTPWPDIARDLFADLLAAGPGLVAVWEGLDQAGVIERWIPEWAAVRSRPQRNPVHRHTVDRHLIETVVYASALVRQVSRADLLLLAALLHDIGKIRGAHDHSVIGAPIASAVATRLGLPPQDVDVVTTLVREHLTVIHLATRRDYQDPRTAEAAREAVGGDRDVFELLLALTEADAVAAGPKAWTDWRATLLRQFAEAARRGFADGPRLGAAPQPDEINHDTIEAVAAGEPHVVVRPQGGTFRIDVFDRDRLGLFADTAGLFAAYGMVVRTAILRTLDGVAANEWYVETPTGQAPDAQQIVRGLTRLAQGDRSPLNLLDRRRGVAASPSLRASSGAPGQARALVVPQAAHDATVLEVRAQDRPGLLHELGMTFARAGLSVRSAHIATYAGQTLDTFYLTEFGGRLLTPAKVAQTVAMVIDTCDSRPT